MACSIWIFLYPPNIHRERETDTTISRTKARHEQWRMRKIGESIKWNVTGWKCDYWKFRTRMRFKLFGEFGAHKLTLLYSVGRILGIAYLCPWRYSRVHISHSFSSSSSRNYYHDADKISFLVHKFNLIPLFLLLAVCFCFHLTLHWTVEVDHTNSFNYHFILSYIQIFWYFLTFSTSLLQVAYTFCSKLNDIVIVYTICVWVCFVSSFRRS